VKEGFPSTTRSTESRMIGRNPQNLDIKAVAHTVDQTNSRWPAGVSHLWPLHSPSHTLTMCLQCHFPPKLIENCFPTYTSPYTKKPLPKSSPHTPCLYSASRCALPQTITLHLPTAKYPHTHTPSKSKFTHKASQRALCALASNQLLRPIPYDATTRSR